MRVMGLMSGTSADGIDAVIVEFEGGADALQWHLVAHTNAPFAPPLR